MDGPIDWWWKMNLLDVCVQAGFCQIRSHINLASIELSPATVQELQSLSGILKSPDTNTCKPEELKPK